MRERENRQRETENQKPAIEGARPQALQGFRARVNTDHRDAATRGTLKDGSKAEKGNLAINKQPKNAYCETKSQKINSTK